MLNPCFSVPNRLQDFCSQTDFLKAFCKLPFSMRTMRLDRETGSWGGGGEGVL